MTPTPEQFAIVEAAQSTSDNLLINALAGAAKTSTLILIANALPAVLILCLAFNKKVADEMRDRLPENCESMTLNSLGHRAWGAAIGRRLVVDKAKMYGILKSLIDKLSKTQKEEAYDNFSTILKNLELAKSGGWIPDGKFDQGKRLVNDEKFFASLDEAPTELEEQLYRASMYESIAQAYKGTIDFNDQIYMPTLFQANFPAFPLVMVDEAQDLSPLNHATLKKLVNRRLIAVGDPCQAIYGFRGADELSMSKLQSMFSMREMVLSISFRCPKAVVGEAQWRAPHMRYPAWAKDGAVRTFTKWTVSDLPSECAIICRNNAPIFSMAVRLFGAGRYAEIVGNDIGKNLIKFLKKLGPPDLPQEQVLAAIAEFEQLRLKKSRSAARVKDECECLRIFARQGDNLSAATAYAEHIMNATGLIKMMTGHKSKGLEFSNVFILNRDLLHLGEGSQDNNLLYVMQTRSKENLTYVASEMFMEA